MKCFARYHQEGQFRLFTQLLASVYEDTNITLLNITLPLQFQS